MKFTKQKLQTQRNWEKGHITLICKFLNLICSKPEIFHESEYVTLQKVRKLINEILQNWENTL